MVENAEVDEDDLTTASDGSETGEEVECCIGAGLEGLGLDRQWRGSGRPTAASDAAGTRTEEVAARHVVVEMGRSI